MLITQRKKKGNFHMNVSEALTQWFTTAGNVIVDIAFRLLAALLVYFIGSVICKKILKKITNSKKIHDKAGKTVQLFAEKAISVSIRVILIVIAVAIMGVPMASVIAIIAAAGATIGLALQGGLSNIASGIILLINKPFIVGNYVEIGSQSGTVLQIDLFNTTLRTPDNKHIVLSNTAVMNTEIVNYSAEATRRVDFTVSVAYGTDTELVRCTLLSIAESHELSLKEPAPMCRLSKFADSSIDFTLRVWVNSADYWTVTFDINEEIKKVFEEKNISIPFPQMDIHLDK